MDGTLSRILRNPDGETLSGTTPGCDAEHSWGQVLQSNNFIVNLGIVVLQNLTPSAAAHVTPPSALSRSFQVSTKPIQDHDAMGWTPPPLIGIQVPHW